MALEVTANAVEMDEDRGTLRWSGGPTPVGYVYKIYQELNRISGASTSGSLGPVRGHGKVTPPDGIHDELRKADDLVLEVKSGMMIPIQIIDNSLAQSGSLDWELREAPAPLPANFRSTSESQQSP